MKRATKEFLSEMENISLKRKNEILNSADDIRITGTVYYVSNLGDDNNNGRTPETAWKTLEKVSKEKFNSGDGVFFRRGDLFRGSVVCQSDVTYAAYGEGIKPRFYGWDKSLADASLWELYDKEHNIWKLTEKILDCGTLVFNDGEKHSRKLIPSYRNSQFVCRDDETKVFEMANEMTCDLDIFCYYTDRLSTAPSKNEDFPIPILDSGSYGDLYLRCDDGNPAVVFNSIEAVPKRSMFICGKNNNVRIDNACIKYCCFGVSAYGDLREGLHVTNCEIGWIGGNIQHYTGEDPNHPQGKRGSVTRFGNGIEIYGGCSDYVVDNCYIYQSYDAGITHQITTNGNTFKMENIKYTNNLIEYCVYGIEYFLEKTKGDTESYIKDCEMANNIIRFSGYGWGQQRHNTYTPAAIKGWSYENTAYNYTVHDNIFDRAAYRMLHLVAKKKESCPLMYNNTYINKLGQTLGQYGSNEVEEPANHSYDERAEEIITNIFGDQNSKVYFMD